MYGRRQCAHRADRSDVEDGSLPLPDHLFVDRLRYGKEAIDVRVDHFVPGAVGGGGEVVAAIDGRIVDEDVNPAPLLDQLARQFLHAHAIDNRDLGIERLAAVALDLFARRGSQIVTRVVTERDICAFARKDFANGRTDATRSAGYERALSLKQQTHLAMFLLEV